MPPQLTPQKLEKFAMAADTHDAVKISAADLRELVRGYRRGLQPAKTRREPVIVGEHALIDVSVTVPESEVTRWTHKGQGQIWAYDIPAVAKAIGRSEAWTRRVARGEIEGMQLRPSCLQDVIDLYVAVHGANTGAS